MKCASCGPKRCHSDFSTREPQKPSLAAIDVVTTIFATAFRNLAKRTAACRGGLMTREALAQANAELVRWAGETFCGKNPAFDTAEGWNPDGLAAHLFSALAPRMRRTVPVDDEEIVRAAAALFLADAQALLDDLLAHGVPPAEAASCPAAIELAEHWASLFCGAPEP